MKKLFGINASTQSDASNKEDILVFTILLGEKGFRDAKMLGFNISRVEGAFIPFPGFNIVNHQINGLLANFENVDLTLMMPD